MSSTAKLTGPSQILEAMPEHPALKAISSLGPQALSGAIFDRSELTLTVDSGLLLAAASALRQAGYNFFEDMTAVDRLPASPRFQLSYHLLSLELKERIRLRVFINEANPSVESITSLWPGANYYEREVFDLFGIRFHGHPNLRRILMPDDWQGHPLRKDYPVEGYR